MAWHSAASKIREAFHILLWFQLKKELWFYFDFFVSLGFWVFLGFFNDRYCICFNTFYLSISWAGSIVSDFSRCSLG